MTVARIPPVSLAWALLLGLAAAACGSTEDPPPAEDTGSPSEDAGFPSEDAGSSNDAGFLDGGFPDAGTAPDPFVLPSQASTTVLDGVRFLFEGPNARQIGVTATITRHRVAAVSGFVRTRGGAPLPDARVRVIGHPEFGETRTDSEGRYDLALDGGGTVRVVIDKVGYIPAARTVDLDWNDWDAAAPAVLVPFDAVVTTVDLTRGETQVHRGTMTDDDRGTRRATMMIPPGTSARVTMPDGSRVDLPTQFNLRLTEVTVGPDGVEAMPGELPRNSAYTYAVEVTIEEVDAMGAATVDFDRPQPIYVENFLEYPVGTAVPHGQFSVLTGRWEPQPDGLIVRIASVDGGVAELVIDDSGMPADAAQLAELGVTPEEQATLATLYVAGDELWRVPLVRMTSLADFNFSFFCNPTCPSQIDAEPEDEPEEGMCVAAGSRIDLDNQAVGERVPLVGTPYALTYKSNRVRGYRAAYQVNIDPYGGRPLHPSAYGIFTQVTVAGRSVPSPEFTPQGGEIVPFDWDGLDAFGRRVQGVQTANVLVGYGVTGFRGCWRRRACAGPSFMQSCQLTSCGGSVVDVYVYLRDQTKVGLHDYTQRDLGGWGLDVQHVYEPARRQLLLGTGEVRSVESLGLVTEQLSERRGGSSANAHPLAVGPDGSVYYAIGATVRRVFPDGRDARIAGQEGRNGDEGDGGAATEALLQTPEGVDLMEDGSVLIADPGADKVRVVRPDGTIDTFAGNGESGSSIGPTDGDGEPAVEAPITNPRDVAVAPDGTVYITSNVGLKRVLTDGTIVSMTPGLRGPPTDADTVPTAELAGIGRSAVTVDAEGRVYVVQGYSSSWAEQIWRLDPTGQATRVAGARCRTTPNSCPSTVGAGGRRALDVHLTSVPDLTVSPTGQLVFVRLGPGDDDYVHVVDDDGVVRAVMGGGEAVRRSGYPSRLVRASNIAGVTYAPDGRLVFADGASVYALRPPYTGLDTDEHAIPSADGREVYVFDLGGRHERTLDGRTGVVTRSFQYDPARRLVGVAERGTLISRFERDADGRVERVVGPTGAVTEIGHDGDGLLASVRNPAGEAYTFTYHDADGLLATATSPSGERHDYTYDPTTGRLVEDRNPASETKQLSSVVADDGTRTMTLGMASGRSLSYATRRDAAGTRTITVTPSGGPATVMTSIPGTQSTLQTPDGATMTRSYTPDPRWGAMVKARSGWNLTLPSGLEVTGAEARAATLDPPGDALGVIDTERSITWGGQTFTAAWSQADRELTVTTPEGRTLALTYDADGRLAERRAAGLAAERWTYTGGRPTQVARGEGAGARTTVLSYDGRGRLRGVRDALGRDTTYGYDDADRRVSRTLADGRVTQVGYDGDGRVASITPPDRPAHTITYDGAGRLAGANPPDVGGVTADAIAYGRDADGRVTRATRPGGAQVDFEYDDVGRVLRVVAPEGTARVDYDPTTARPTTLIAATGGTLSYTWDGPVVAQWTWAGPVAGTVDVTRDARMLVTESRVGEGTPVTYTYDGDGLPVGGAHAAGSLAATRDPDHGRVVATTLASVTTARTYDPFGAVATEAAAYLGADLWTQTLTRDGGGRVSEVVETVAGASTTRTYRYDGTGRLTSVDVDGTPRSAYVYDDNGNLISKSHAGTTVMATYDDQDRLTTWDGQAVTYDVDGRLRAVPRMPAATELDYDSFGNLTRVRVPEGRVVTYDLDPLHRRVGKRVDGQRVRGWLYRDGLNPIADLDGVGAVIAEFVYVTKRNVPDVMIRGTDAYRIVSDDRGSVRLVVNAATGMLAQRLDYDALGQVTFDSQPGFQPFGFAGGLYDPDTGLVRLGARDYDGRLGRWLTPDPAGFAAGGTNLYAYGWLDPVNTVDITGLGPAPTIYLGWCTAACWPQLGFGPAVQIGWEHVEVGFGPSYDYPTSWAQLGIMVFPAVNVPGNWPMLPPGLVTTLPPVPPPGTPPAAPPPPAPPGTPPSGPGPGVIVPGLTILTPVDVSDLDTVVPTPEIACAIDVDDLPVLEPVDVDDLPVLEPIGLDDLPVPPPLVIGAQ